MNLEEEISKGNFVVPECPTCKKIVWPSSTICNSCFNYTVLKHGPREGKILEFSKTGDAFFCIVEFKNQIRLICTLISQKTPKIGDKVSLISCGINNGNYVFTVSL